MPAYHASVVDCEGRLYAGAFRNTWRTALQAAKYDFTGIIIWGTAVVADPRPGFLFHGLQNRHFNEPMCSNVESEAKASLAESTPSRLKLVLDLDNTLLHAQSEMKIGKCAIALEDHHDYTSNTSSLYRFQLPKHAGVSYYVKLRPGAREFLQELSQHYILAIHTNAKKEYADVILSILDPNRSLFELRVAAREDESGKDERKDLSRLFEPSKCKDSMIIVDDRRDVWDNSVQQNILHCHYYEYFESRRDALVHHYSHAEKGSPITPALHDDDRQLFYLTKLFTAVAHEFYDSPSSSVPAILQRRRSEILAGCVILMTGYHKAEQTSQFGMLDSGPEHARRLTSMGAEIVDEPSAAVTHVVVMRQTISTDKARRLCVSSTKFVHNLWIYACEQTWTRIDESLFDSTLLLATYKMPPIRPSHEHWSITKNACDRRQTSESAVDEQSLSATPSLEASPSSLSSPHTISRQPSYKEQTWPASAIVSEGAETWAAYSHTVLHFDPFIVGQIQHKART